MKANEIDIIELLSSIDGFTWFSLISTCSKYDLDLHTTLQDIIGNGTEKLIEQHEDAYLERQQEIEDSL